MANMRKTPEGKICIPISVSTVGELKAAIRQAEPFADIIEIRFDGLAAEELEKVFAENDLGGILDSARPIIATFRPEAEGGGRNITHAEREKFWSLLPCTSYCDAEFEIAPIAFTGRHEGRICSFHDFSGVAPDMGVVFARLGGTGADIIKIAMSARTAIDAISVWQTIKTAVHSGKTAIPVAMGEGGKWTRILGPAYGSLLTYASLTGGAETAPGQISAEDMAGVFRVNELTPETVIYGIIGGDTSYSISPWMQNAAFMAAGKDRVFVPFQTLDVEEFFCRMVRMETREVELNFGGFAVTNPHKTAIIPLLDEIDPVAQAIGAVNTVKLDGDIAYGYNTDAHGFITPLKEPFGDLKGSRAAIVGSGGAARACAFALRNEGSEVCILARDRSKAESIANEIGASAAAFEREKFGAFSGFDILVNTTPLGTQGAKQNETIAFAEDLKGLRMVYDLIYNPLETALIAEANKAGVDSIGGMEMLIAQGAKQFEIWTDEDAPVGAMRTAVIKRLGL